MIEGGGVVHGGWWNRSTKGGLTCTVFISLAGRPDSPKDPPAALNELPGKPAACTRPKQRRTFAPWLVSPREVLVRLQRGAGGTTGAGKSRGVVPARGPALSADGQLRGQPVGPTVLERGVGSVMAAHGLSPVNPSPNTKAVRLP